jgi:hypothetical protein
LSAGFIAFHPMESGFPLAYMMIFFPCGVPQELFCMAKMRYFRGTGMIFPKVGFTLDVI